jgi:hypothetical protein
MTIFYHPWCIVHANIMNLTRTRKCVKTRAEVLDWVH